MEDGSKQEMVVSDVRGVIRDAIESFIQVQQARAEPAYKAELIEERRRREHLERRVNELVEENKRSRQLAEEADRNAIIRGELQRLGVTKVDLAYRAVREDVVRSEDGRLVARGPGGEMPVRDYLSQFVSENPELLPARVPGGSGAGAASKVPSGTGGTIEIDKIRPGMKAEDLERAREEIARLASQALRGL